MVTHLLGCPGQLSAFSNSSMAPLDFFNFLTSASTAFSAHFSSSSPCFQPNSFLTAGLVNENRLFIDEIVDDERLESNSSTSILHQNGRTTILVRTILPKHYEKLSIILLKVYLLLLLLFRGREKGKRASLIRIQRRTAAVRVRSEWNLDNAVRFNTSIGHAPDSARATLPIFAHQQV